MKTVRSMIEPPENRDRLDFGHVPEQKAFLGGIKLKASEKRKIKRLSNQLDLSVTRMVKAALNQLYPQLELAE